MTAFLVYRLSDFYVIMINIFIENIKKGLS